MKKIDVYLAALLILVIGLSSLNFKKSFVIGQTVSPTPASATPVVSPSANPSVAPSVTPATTEELPPSGGGEVNIATESGTPSGELTVSENFTGIWKAKLPKKGEGPPASPAPSSTPSNTSTPSATPVASPTPQTSPSAAPSSTPATSATPAANSSPVVVRTLFTQLDDTFGSRIITLRLCVKEGKLEGVIHRGGGFINGRIVSQEVISPEEVIVTVESAEGETEVLTLRLTGDREMVITFANGKELVARKLNPLRSCLSGVEPTAPGGGGGTFGGRPGMGSPGGMGGPGSMGEPGGDGEPSDGEPSDGGPDMSGPFGGMGSPGGMGGPDDQPSPIPDETPGNGPGGMGGPGLGSMGEPGVSPSPGGSGGNMGGPPGNMGGPPGDSMGGPV